MSLLTTATRRRIRRETRARESTTSRRRPHWALPVVAALAAAVAVAALVALLAQRDSGDDRVLVRTEEGSVALIDRATGASLFEVEDAVVTPDRSALLTTRRFGDDTLLQSRSPSTGSVTGTTTLTGELVVRTVSPSSTAVALMPHRAGEELYEPTPRETTELTIAYLDDRSPLHLTLDGNIEPEMFSLDESTLFVLEFVPPTDPTGYYVKKLDLATGELTATDGHEVDINPAMRGRARAQAMHPDGTFLYTLYTLPNDAPVQDDAATRDADRWAFVHVISLEEEWSHCVFLPVPFGVNDESALGMAVAPDGDTVVVVDPAVGQVAELDTRTNTVRAVHDVPDLRREGDTAVVAVADDGRTYVGLGSLVLELGAGHFSPTRSWGQRATVTALSAAGDELRIGGDGEVVLLDRRTGREAGVIARPDGGTLELLGPPRGSVTEFPLDCAC